jgi:hypothetical protein
MDDRERIKVLEEQIVELKRQWPAHSVPPTMLQRLDDLEDELERLRSKMRVELENAKEDGID